MGFLLLSLHFSNYLLFSIIFKMKKKKHTSREERCALLSNDNYFFILKELLSGTTRLKTRASGAESLLSTQK